jgi:Mg2+ and Co2+ transporter CorA
VRRGERCRRPAPLGGSAARAGREYCALEGDDEKEDRARLLFVILDHLLGSFRPHLLALDDRLAELQLGMLGGIAQNMYDELVQILGILTDGIQELGWYAHDLEDVAGAVDRLPGMRPGAEQHCERHRQGVTRVIENSKSYREEARDALDHYEGLIAGRQAKVLSTLTVVATVFLPLSFLTGYFGMNFTTLTTDVQSKFWEFILLALLLPIASAALSLLLIRRLQRRSGITGLKD